MRSYKTIREYVLQKLYPEKLYLKQDINLGIQLDKNKHMKFHTIFLMTLLISVL